MEYLEDHSELKENPQKLAPRAQSALVFTKNYLPHPYPLEPPIKALKTALYSQGKDYHLEFLKTLQRLSQKLKKHLPEEEFLAFTDSSPVLERDLAQKAGLGWVGKNTCLIHPKRGSLFFIGEIYTSLKLEFFEEQKIPFHCGSCTRCLEACPTEALVEPFKLDARKCISYWTIEAKKQAPEFLRQKIGDWFFGCDICQTVCPWNQKVFKPHLLESKKPHPELLIEDLRFLLTASHKKLQKAFKGSALSRAGPKGLKRNALIVIGNLKLKVLKPEVMKVSEHKDFTELAQWTLEKISFP